MNRPGGAAATAALRGWDFALPQAAPRLSWGVESLDRLAGGGIPVGQITEISGSSSSGKSTLALHLCARALAERAVGWIGPAHTFCPLGALEAGLPTERLLVLHVSDGLSALRGAQILLGCPSAVAVLVLNLPAHFLVRPAQLQALQRLAAHSQTALVLLTERAPDTPALGPLVALRLHVQRGDQRDDQTGSLTPLRVEVLRHKGGPSQQSIEEWFHGPDRLRLHCTL